MQDLQKSLAPLLKELTGAVSPLVIAVILVAVPLAIVAFKWLKDRWEKQKDGDEGSKAGARPVLQKVPAGRYVGVWKRFLRDLPPIFRRSILNFQPFVVMGGAGSGKSQLIETYTDWQRQAKQFLGSIVDDPNLQIYLGSKTLVMELPSTALHETSTSGRAALVKLWAPIFKKRAPIVVVPVDLIALSSAQPDAVRALADTIRGKLSLLSWIHKQPVEVRIALTHFDEILGFQELTKLVERERIPATLTLPEGLSDHQLEGALAERFAEFDRLIPLALTTLSSPDFTRLVSFLREAPKYLPLLAAFLSALLAPDPLSKRPKLERIYLTSRQFEGGSTNPFHAAVTFTRTGWQNPLLPHRIAAASVVLVLGGYLWFGYAHELQLWRRAETAALVYPGAAEQRNRTIITSFRDRRRNDPLMKFFPSFFDEGEKKLDLELAKLIRQQILLPKLQESLASDWPFSQSIYFLGLLYATTNNDLGDLIRKDALNWHDATGLDTELITDYVAAAHEPYKEKPSLSRLPSTITANPTNDAQEWILYFTRLQHAIAHGYVTPPELGELQTEGKRLLESAEVVERFAATADILDRLDKTTLLNFKAIYEPFSRQIRSKDDLFGGRIQDVKALLSLIRKAQISPSGEPVKLLSDLSGRLQLVVDQKTTDESRTYSLRFAKDQTFTFKSDDWNKLVKDSAIRELVVRFIALESETTESIFFAKTDRFEDVIMNPRNDGTYLFTGKGVLNGRYTRVAIDKNVRPALRQFVDLLARIDLGAEERAPLEDFVHREMERYSAAYAKAIESYYNSFGVQADSAEALELVLKQMTSPVSPFHELLRTIDTNTTLALDVDARTSTTTARLAVKEDESQPDELLRRLLEPLQSRAERYAPIHTLLEVPKSGKPELDTYLLFLGQLIEGLRSGSGGAQPAAGKGGSAPAASEAKGGEGLAEALTPVGRMGLAILRADESSARSQVLDWLSNVRVPSELHRPFLAPIDQLYGVGVRDIEKVVADKWRFEVLKKLADVTTKFPFDVQLGPDKRIKNPDATEEDMTAMFHPMKGEFHDLVRRYVEPISQMSDGEPRMQKGDLRVPAGMYEVIERVALLTRRLWDSDGRAQPLKLKVAPAPFEPNTTGWVTTLVYLGSGTSALVNFNQHPAFTAIEVDWTKLTSSRLSLELMDRTSGEKVYPSPLEVSASGWSLLRLLKSKDCDFKDRQLSCSFVYGSHGEHTTRAKFVFDRDPLEVFMIRRPGDTVARLSNARASQ